MGVWVCGVCGGGRWVKYTCAGKAWQRQECGSSHQAAGGLRFLHTTCCSIQDPAGQVSPPSHQPTHTGAFPLSHPPIPPRRPPHPGCYTAPTCMTVMLFQPGTVSASSSALTVSCTGPAPLPPSLALAASPSCPSLRLGRGGARLVPVLALLRRARGALPPTPASGFTWGPPLPAPAAAAAAVAHAGKEGGPIRVCALSGHAPG